jgi:hypothetical protein
MFGINSQSLVHGKWWDIQWQWTRIRCIHDWGTTTTTMTPFCFMSIVLKQGLNKMNVLRCSTIKRGYLCLSFQLINVLMNDSNQLNKFWMFCPSITKKECMITKHFHKNDILSFEMPNPYWKHKIMSYFGTHISYTSFQICGM